MVIQQGTRSSSSLVELTLSWRESEADRQLSNHEVVMCQEAMRSGEETTRGPLWRKWISSRVKGDEFACKI